MNTIIRLSLLVFMAALVFSCHRHSVSAEDDYKQREQIARKYLAPLLPIGESITNVITQFGTPFEKSETQTHELRMDFIFPESSKAERSAGVVGFVAFFTTNQLTRWEPVFKIPIN